MPVGLVTTFRGFLAAACMESYALAAMLIP